MAYGDGGNVFKRLWAPNLENRVGARAATDVAGLGLYIVAAWSSFPAIALAANFFADGPAKASPEGIASFVIFVAMLILYVAAGWRLRQGKGLVIGGVVAFLSFLNFLASFYPVPSPGGIIVNLLIVAVLIGGVRAAYRLSQPEPFDDD